MPKSLEYKYSQFFPILRSYLWVHKLFMIFFFFQCFIALFKKFYKGLFFLCSSSLFSSSSTKVFLINSCDTAIISYWFPYKQVFVCYIHVVALNKILWVQQSLNIEETQNIFTFGEVIYAILANIFKYNFVFLFIFKQKSFHQTSLQYTKCESPTYIYSTTNWMSS